MGEQTTTGSVSSTNPLGVALKETFLLADGRVEINWEPVEMEPPEELEYLQERHDIPVYRTEMQAALKQAPIHYLFKEDVGPEGQSIALWRGIRCPRIIWELLMRAKGASDEQVAAWVAAVDAAPKKKLIPKDLTESPTPGA